MSKVAYDPKYGLPERLQDVTLEHATYCEHSFCEYLQMKGRLEEWKVVAKLEQLD